MIFFTKNFAKVLTFTYFCKKNKQNPMVVNLESLERPYYNISEISEMFEVAPSLLRYWESEFPSLRPKKTPGGSRLYTPEDIAELNLIYDLVKTRNMKLKAARELIQSNRRGAKSTNDILNRLQVVRRDLMEIKSELDAIV